mmetsp:Transcript_29161/g.73289  ORF Transcript_29161/g.73289 Transcript_29161/m.73289 type:complete len:143 (-) Transcript_29161:31-459(-)
MLSCTHSIPECVKPNIIGGAGKKRATAFQGQVARQHCHGYPLVYLVPPTLSSCKPSESEGLQLNIVGGREEDNRSRVAQHRRSDYVYKSEQPQCEPELCVDLVSPLARFDAVPLAMPDRTPSDVGCAQLNIGLSTDLRRSEQ